MKVVDFAPPVAVVVEEEIVKISQNTPLPQALLPQAETLPQALLPQALLP